MKIVILNTYTSGGAAKAAIRLNNALNSIGVDSNILHIHGETVPNSSKYTAFSPLSRISRFLPSFYKQNKYKKYRSQIPFTNSFPECCYDITDHPLIKEADIVNLHWVGEMINYKSFFKKIKKPIVWTLHDMNPFMGFSHYKYDLGQYPELQELDDKILQLKYNAISQHPNISVVALCDWMKQHSESSLIFKDRPHYIIPNSLDTSVFYLHDRKAMKKEHGLDLDKTSVMFCSDSISDSRKGFDILFEALPYIKSDVQYMVVGSKSESFKLPSNFHYFGMIKEEIKLSRLYSAADIFVIPSREDNLPNTMLESLCCGTPVISFSNGGMKNVINETNGILVKKMDAMSLAKSIDIAISEIGKFENRTISEIAVQNFTPEVQAKSYLSVFESLNH